MPIQHVAIRCRHRHCADQEIPHVPRQVRKLGRGRIAEKLACRHRGSLFREPRPDLGPTIPRLIPLEPGRSLGHASAMDPLPSPFAFFLLLFSGWVNRHQQPVIDYVFEENLVLRAAQGPRRLCLTDDKLRRLAVKGKVLGRRRLANIAGVVTPDNILRWYRKLVAAKYDGSQTRRPGRPSTKPDIAALVVRMASQNPTWGYTRIRGGLKRVGHDMARDTIKAIVKDHGIEPAPERGTNSLRPRPRSAQARSRAVRGSAACSSSTTAKPRSPLWPSFRPRRGVTTDRS